MTKSTPQAPGFSHGDKARPAMQVGCASSALFDREGMSQESPGFSRGEDVKPIKRRGLAGRGLYLGVGLAVGLGLAAHGASASVIRTACRSGGTSKSPAAVVRPAHQSALFVHGQHRWWLTLQRVAVVPQLHGQYSSARAHGKFVVVFLVAQNVGKAPQSLGFDQDFALTDAQGRQFGTASADANSAATEVYKLDDTYSPQVQPTFSAHVAFVFDVAADAHGLRLLNVPSFGGSTQKLFSLGL